ncbi:phosphohydrolase [Tumebacillus algifaecis]|uniref:Phosphohydrolase n=1 Tax=Tumebacillus algifaecis TaxID=1214604 RepID=A0A223CZR2_9BACL|nr:HD domain-containing protein [Tumebacillus algifaecis]ASS74633.1 phosphohydrolase [Tumebacillus algifaecis]
MSQTRVEQHITLAEIKELPQVRQYIVSADKFLKAMGFTEHGFRHVTLVSNIAENVMELLGYSERERELAAIAGYIHDIGNITGRHDHGKAGAIMCFHILEQIGMPYEEIACIVGAVGNHEEQYGEAVNTVAAALILADKSDVHRTRVRRRDVSQFDIHDRVNYSATSSFLDVNSDTRAVTLKIEIDNQISSVMEYFEIFMERMMMCQRAAKMLDARFRLNINGADIL